MTRETIYKLDYSINEVSALIYDEPSYEVSARALTSPGVPVVKKQDSKVEQR